MKLAVFAAAAFTLMGFSAVASATPTTPELSVAERADVLANSLREALTTGCQTPGADFDAIIVRLTADQDLEVIDRAFRAVQSDRTLAALWRACPSGKAVVDRAAFASSTAIGQSAPGAVAGGATGVARGLALGQSLSTLPGTTGGSRYGN